MKAALDFPDLNFLVYHSGFRGIDQEIAAQARSEFAKSASVPWVTELCDWKRKHPEVRNVYMELGAIFGMTAITFPLLCTHMLGMMIAAFGDDHVLWGTDSIWWGSPQWQIEAFKRLEMPESLMKRFGYKPLTVDVKRKILGLNAARVYGVDPAAKIGPMPEDLIDRLRKKYEDSGLAARSNTQYGWVRETTSVR
jgi:predicted TIM-barrel fold metal-dependent hydrolase